MFWNIIYAYITVNFYWSELDTLSGQIYCTLDKVKLMLNLPMRKKCTLTDGAILGK